MDTFTILLIVAFVAGSITGIVIWKKLHTGKCKGCGEPVKLQFTNVSPAGPNPLGIYLTGVKCWCKKCGKLDSWTK